MKTHFLSLLLLAIILVSSCSQEEIVQQQTVSLSDCKFIASFEQTESRTYLEDGKYLRWTANDELSVFMGKTLNRQFRFTGETGDNSGGFEEASSPGFVTGNDLDNPCHYAIYPYAKGTKITETGVLTVNLPSEQTYEENSFGCGANTMVAVTSSLSDMELSFKNACGYLKFKLYGDDVTVKSVTLQSNGDEKLSGSATLIAANDKNPSITMSSTASDMITLDCGTGVKIGSTSETATEFWFVVPPTTFESGFTVTIKDVNDNEFTKSTSKKISIERNVIKPISAFEVDCKIVLTSNYSNGIAYVVNAGELSSIIPAEEKNNITSLKISGYLNSADMLFLKDMAKTTKGGKLAVLDLEQAAIENGEIGSSAFEDCDALTDVILGNSVTEIGISAFEECDNLKDITIGSGVTRIWPNAFLDCPSLTNVYISDLSAWCNIGFLRSNSDEDYDSNPLWGSKLYLNNNLVTELVIPNDITSISTAAFCGLSNITKITIHDNVTSIGGFAFYDCSATNVVIGKGVTSIGSSAFWNSDVTSVVFESETPPTIKNVNVFPANSDLLIYVPSTAIDRYKTATNWTFFADKIKPKE